MKKTEMMKLRAAMPDRYKVFVKKVGKAKTFAEVVQRSGLTKSSAREYMWVIGMKLEKTEKVAKAKKSANKSEKKSSDSDVVQD